MSETTTTSLDEMLTDAPVTEVQPEPTPAPEPSGDTLQEAPPAPEPSAELKAKDAPMVPRQALEDERRKRQDYEKRIAELERQFTQPQPQQQPQQPQRKPVPDMFADPEGYTAWVEEQITERSLSTAASISRRFAEKEYGADVVQQVLQSAPADLCNQLFYTSQDPFGDLMSWHKRQQLLNEIGDDPSAYEAKLRAKWEAEMNGAAPPPPQSATPPAQKAPVPKSLARTPSAQPRDPSTGRWQGPTPLSDILSD